MNDNHSSVSASFKRTAHFKTEIADHSDSLACMVEGLAVHLSGGTCCRHPYNLNSLPCCCYY